MKHVDWKIGNTEGRDAARRAIVEARRTRDLPGLVAAIKDAARAEGDARAVGFLYQVADRLVR